MVNDSYSYAIHDVVEYLCVSPDTKVDECEEVYVALVETLRGYDDMTIREWTGREDSIWQLRSAFAIMTMQSGFALLETGCVSAKNIANIMVKNIVDATLGGLSYWVIGYGLSFGRPSSWFCGMGDFMPYKVAPEEMGSLYTRFFFQFSFASTATTIVSGSVAERMNLHGYMVYSILNTLSYCIPASWAWGDNGFLANLGFHDFAGTCAVHGNGGVSALVAAVMIGPRMHRWEDPESFGMSSPVTALTGTLLLWWAWFAFNCGSTLGSIGEDGHLWKINALVAVNTLNGSVGGACLGMLVSMILKKGQIDVTWLINSILGGLVAITGICSVTTPLECLIIGAIGASVAIVTTPLIEWWKIDDPVGAIPVHFFTAIWGTLCVGIFAKNDAFNTLKGHNGLFHGGGFYLLGIQALGLICITSWSAITTWIFLLVIDKTIGIRMTPEEEELGADICEHGINKAEGLRGMVAGHENKDDRRSSSAFQFRGALSRNMTFSNLPVLEYPRKSIAFPNITAITEDDQSDTASIPTNNTNSSRKTTAHKKISGILKRAKVGSTANGRVGSGFLSSGKHVNIRTPSGSSSRFSIRRPSRPATPATGRNASATQASKKPFAVKINANGVVPPVPDVKNLALPNLPEM